MVNIGDTVSVSVRTWVPSLELFANRRNDLQSRLQSAGFRVLQINDQLSWTGGYGDLLVTLQPLVGAYGSPNDIASIVAGVAYAVGYGGAESYSGQIVSSNSGYEQNLGAGPAYNPNDQNNDLPNFGGLPLSTWALAGAALLVVFALKR